MFRMEVLVETRIISMLFARSSHKALSSPSSLASSAHREFLKEYRRKTMKLPFLLLSAVAMATAFTSPVKVPNRISRSQVRLMKADNVDESSTPKIRGPVIPAATTAALWALTSSSAMAAGPDWGIFEGKTLSLLHPAMMAAMLGFSISTALLGFDWRRQRTIGDEISGLKKTLPDLGGASSVAEAVKAAEASGDTMLAAKLKTAAPIESQIKELQDERKALSEKGARDKHFSQGSLLAFIGTVFAIEGPLNTYGRTGKLFPGPHLYAGAGLVCLWALAAACVPAMQKGDDTARTVHIGANLVGIGLFGWQVVSGIPILLKVIEKAPWP